MKSSKYKDEEFDRLQNKWQHQETSTPDIETVIMDLNHLEIKNKRSRIWLTLLFPATVIVLLVLIPVMKSPLYLTGILLIGAGMLMLLTMLYRNKFGDKVDMESGNNQVFVKNQTERLKQRLQIASVFMWVYTWFILAGINIVYLEALAGLDLALRIMLHVSITALFVGIMYFTINKKKTQNERELIPLIKQLEGFSEVQG